jgi:hypothetical protein
MPTANEHFFQPPLAPRTLAAASAGIRNPQEELVAQDELLYRFASSTNPSSAWAAGPWWWRRDDIVKMLAASKKTSLTFGFTARIAGAVQQSWCKMDRLIKAVVKEDLLAYTGRGQTQYREMAPNGMYITLAGWSDVTQLFIPGLGEKGVRTPLGLKALDVIVHFPIESLQLY